MNHTEESKKLSNVYFKTWGVYLTAESDSVVCIPPQSGALRCASYSRVQLRGVHHKAVSILTKCLFLSEVLQMLFSVMPEYIN